MMRMLYGSIRPANPPDRPETEKQALGRMMAALGSYPWDSAASVSLAAGALGVHVRGETPVALPTWEGLSLAADVRLDNRPELCAELALDGAERAALDDAELILRAYRRWGLDCPAHLLGDFAFALWDEPQQRLLCARDVAGVRPFYYQHTAGRLIFASDLLAMAAHPDVRLTFNLAYVATSLQTTAGMFQHPEHTYYQSIEKLAPAHCLALDAGGLRQWAYWQPGQTPERRYADEREYGEELKALLNAAITCRVTDPHPVGAHLSGGLDSSSIAVLTQRILKPAGRAVTGFSWAPPLPVDPAELPAFDERKLVEEVRAAEGFQVRYTRLTPAHILAYSQRDITLQPTTTLQYELAASEDAAGMGIRTMLSGWGGDELPAFNGRGYFADLLRRGHWLTLQRELSLQSKIHGGNVGRNWLARGVGPLLPSAILNLLKSERPAPAAPYPAYLRPELRARLAQVQPLRFDAGRELPGVHRMQIMLLQHGHLSYRMESWASHGASLGITYAFPLLDRRLIEFALSIPDYLFFKNGWKRYLYRSAMAGILPDSLRWQKFKGDPAMVQGSIGPRQQAEAAIRADLLARGDNPYIEIKQLVSALDAEQKMRATLTADELSQVARGRMRATNTAGRGRWLAFVNTKTGLETDRPA